MKLHSILKLDIEYARNPGLKDQKDYYTVEQIKEKFGLSREEVYSLARYKNIQKKRDGRFTLFLRKMSSGLSMSVNSKLILTYSIITLYYL